MHVTEAKKLLRVKIPFIADNMDNSIRLTWGNIPNPAFILDSGGRVIYMAAWADPELVRPELIDLAGPVDRPTIVADLDVRKDYKFNLEPGDTTILSTVGRALAGGPGAQPGDARNQTTLCYASPALQP